MGHTIEVEIADIAKDDMIAVERGDQIVGDGVVAASSGLQVDESLLTGQSVPQDKACEAPLLSGSFVVAAQGSYRATAGCAPDPCTQRKSSEAPVDTGSTGQYSATPGCEASSMDTTHPIYRVLRSPLRRPGASCEIPKSQHWRGLKGILNFRVWQKDPGRATPPGGNAFRDARLNR
nr:hypothetical protein [Paraburkholderia mimosarum]